MVNVVFLHPDLGIGGAERLVVDAALALKSRGHNVHLVTNHHDPEHCFAETRDDGGLAVTVVGDWLPRSLGGLFCAAFAYCRMIYAAFYLLFFSDIAFDVVVCDQVSAVIPVLKLKRIPVLFYCHFPDQLQTKRTSWLRRFYRMPLDWTEEFTTGKADKILVNSKFTAGVFHNTFKSLKCDPEVLYPSINFSQFDRPVSVSLDHLKLEGVQYLFLSINRYERKKNLGLAFKALAVVRDSLKADKWKGVHLIMAGGYDKRVTENVEHYEELLQLTKDLKLEDNVTFLRSFNDEEKKALLHSCTCLLYTPDNEHFGIVPLEAMYMCRPVIAVNSGGPKETILLHETGFLCLPTPEDFANAMKNIISDKDLAKEMGITGKEHVRKTFSFASFTEQLNRIILDLSKQTEKNKKA